MTGIKVLISAVALFCVLLAGVRLELPRSMVTIEDLEVGQTPARFYQPATTTGAAVVIAHGFAGSMQMRESFALTRAEAGLPVISFDFEGHGRIRVPMSGDVTSVDGTTALLVAETRAVIAAARELTGEDAVALLGHSMASDVIVRAAQGDADVQAVVAVSMYSEAVSKAHPHTLLIITGAGEPHLRRAAVDALRLVDPRAEEGQTVARDGVLRRAVVAPWVEHVGVMQSRTALREARDWIAGERISDPVTAPGPWLLLLLAAIVALAWPLSTALGPERTAPPALKRGQFWIVIMAPALLTPLVLRLGEISWLPVLVADYLAMHLLVYGALQLALLIWCGVRPEWPRPVAVLALAGWGILVFGLALDRYGASFWPTPERWQIIAAVALGAVMTASLRSALRERSELREELTRVTPLGRIADVAEAAEAALFLASDASSFITGQILTVDGGRANLDPLATPAL